MYDHATFQDGSPAHSESVDTKTRSGKRGKAERGQKRCGVSVCRPTVARRCMEKNCLGDQRSLRGGQGLNTYRNDAFKDIFSCSSHSL